MSRPAPAAGAAYGEWISNHPRLAGVDGMTRERIGWLAADRTATPRQVVDPATLGADTAATWTLSQTQPMSATAGILTTGTMPGAAGDRVIIVGAGTGAAGDPANYVGIVSNITSATPTVTKSPAIDSTADGVAVLLNFNATQALVATVGGFAYAVNIADGSIAWSRQVPGGVSWATPWYEFGSRQLLVADTSGAITSIDADSGTVTWQLGNLGSGGPSIHSSPLAFNNIIWVGADNGSLYRVNETTGFVLGNPINLCLNSSSCTSQDQIWGGPTIDSVNNKLLIGVNKRLIQIDLTACTAATTDCTFTAFPIDEGAFASNTARHYSSPTIDNPSGGFAYVAFDNRLWRAPYNNGIVGGFVRATTPNDATGLLRGANPADNAFPRGLPINFNGQVFIGDGGGFLHRFTADATTFAESAFKSFANAGAGTPGPQGPAIDSTALIDYFGANVYFSVRNPNSPVGLWASLPQNFTSDTTTAGPAVRLRVQPASGTVAASTPFSFTVTALDASGNVATGYTGTVRFVSSDAGATLPAAYTFTGADQGNRVFASGATMTVSGHQTITAIDSGYPASGIIGVGLVCVGASCTNAVISPDAVAYQGAAPIVSWGHTTGSSSDWVAIAVDGSPLTSYVTFTFTNGAVQGATSFAGLTQGTYRARVFSNGSYNLLAESVAFTIQQGSVTTNKAAYSQFEPITVNFVGLDGAAVDWIALAVDGSPLTSYVTYQLTGGQVNGSLTFASGLSVGTYVARAFKNGSYVLQAQSAPFTVGGTSVSTSASAYPAGGAVTVNFSGMSGQPGDWIGIAPDGSPDTSYTQFVLTATQSGSVVFNNLPNGTWRARAYFKYDFNRKAESAAFTVGP